MPYDWRLSLPVMQQRDGYYLRMKATIEVMVAMEGEKAVLISHSMGGIVT